MISKKYIGRRFILILLTSVCTLSVWAQQINRGVAYFREKKYDLALPILQRDAKAGNVAVLSYLGYMYEEGLGVEKSEQIAVNLYNKGVEQDDPYCIIAMGRLHEKKSQNEKAFGYYFKAAELDNVDGLCQVTRCFFEGIGTPKDHHQALEYAIRAADEGASSYYGLVGDMYYYGLGTPVNYEKALEWYTRGLESNYNDDARLRKAEMYYKGRGTTHNSRKYSSKKFPQEFIEEGETGPAKVTDALAILQMLLDDNYSTKAKELYDEVLKVYVELDTQSKIIVSPKWSDDAEIYVRNHREPPRPAIASAGYGTIIISCTVAADGSIKNPRFQKRLLVSFDNVAMDLVSKMPKLIPGTKGGKPVDMDVNFTIQFHRLKVSMARR